MAYEDLCMYCFSQLDGDDVCPHCGKDNRAAVPANHLTPGSMLYHSRFLVGRALGQDASGIVYVALDTKRGGTLRIREYLPRNCALRAEDGTVVSMPDMVDTFMDGMRRLRATVEGAEDPKKRHFPFDENGTLYIAQRKNLQEDGASVERDKPPRRSIVPYLLIGVLVLAAVAGGVIFLMNRLSTPVDAKAQPTLEPSVAPGLSWDFDLSEPAATWVAPATATPTPYATATFPPLVDPELSWMDFTAADNEVMTYEVQAERAEPTQKPTITQTQTGKYATVKKGSARDTVVALQDTLREYGWLDAAKSSGVYDDATRQAVREFQDYVNTNCSPAERLSVDGVAGPKTQQWLYNASVRLTRPTPSPTPFVTPEPKTGVINAKSSEKDINALQKKLRNLGLIDSVNGRYGRETERAVSSFQKRVNALCGYEALSVSGEADADTLAYLDHYTREWQRMQKATSTPAPTATATPRPEDKVINGKSSSEEIAEMQRKLIAVKLLPRGSADGKYGNKTISAVKSFQEWINARTEIPVLNVSGAVDVNTMKYLNHCMEQGYDCSTGQSATEAPTEVPTARPTETPTEAPTEAPAAPGREINRKSSKSDIRYLQGLLAEAFMLPEGYGTGRYDDATKNAVAEVQHFINRTGLDMLEENGVCDALTRMYLEQAVEEGWNMVDTGDFIGDEDYADAEIFDEDQTVGEDAIDDADLNDVEVFDGTEDVAVEEPAAPSLTLSVDAPLEDGVYHISKKSTRIRWGGDDVKRFSAYVTDGFGKEIWRNDKLKKYYLDMPISNLEPGITYSFHLNALLKSGETIEANVLLFRDAAPTAEPAQEAEVVTPEPTVEPRLANLSVNLGGETYQQGGIPYLAGDSVIFTWQAEGDVESYTVTLIDDGGSEYSLGQTRETSKTVDVDYLASLGTGIWQIRVRANGRGGIGTETELSFGVPARAAESFDEAEEAETFDEEEPEAEAPEAVDNDIARMQWKLYQLNLLDPDSAQAGVLDIPTLEAVAAYQSGMNEKYGSDLPVLDPYTATDVDAETRGSLLGDAE